MSLGALHWRSCLHSHVPPRADITLSMPSEGLDSLEVSAYQTTQKFFLTFIAGTVHCQRHSGSLQPQQLLWPLPLLMLSFFFRLLAFKISHILLLLSQFSASCKNKHYQPECSFPTMPPNDQIIVHLLSLYSILCLAVRVLFLNIDLIISLLFSNTF